MPGFAIEVKGLKKSFGSHDVLRKIDFTVPKGSIFALLGPNGAGKTTLINILSTLVEPDAGSVKVAGYDLHTDKEQIKTAISLTGQFAAVDEILTAEENLQMMGRLLGLTVKESRERAEEMLRQFDLASAAHKRVKTYSGGMRRRLDLAISLIVAKPILFLDEPTTGLDTASRRSLWAMILNLKKQGMTIFLTTQYLEEADQLADHIALIADGRVVVQGTASELKARIGGEVVEFRNAEGQVISESPTNGYLRDIQAVITNQMDALPETTKMSIRQPSLDDVFFAFTSYKKEEAKQ
ncbi:ATP-binding cassette domain-containing protein [Sporolactobacillus sp. Y61]|uniref:ATP-binding cassette domain-containing protein n=1 Tax=Sporolactobacillus sp. Y61 TaxID=3160863 RepID=A0AAU8IFC6_9BACL